MDCLETYFQILKYKSNKFRFKSCFMCWIWKYSRLYGMFSNRLSIFTWKLSFSWIIALNQVERHLSYISSKLHYHIACFIYPPRVKLYILTVGTYAIYHAKFVFLNIIVNKRMFYTRQLSTRNKYFYFIISWARVHNILFDSPL